MGNKSKTQKNIEEIVAVIVGGLAYVGLKTIINNFKNQS